MRSPFRCRSSRGLGQGGEPTSLGITGSGLSLAMCLGLVLPLLGCGGSQPPASSQKTTSTPSKESAKTSKASAESAPSTASRSKLVRVDIDGRKWIGDIPYDVFFDDPLAVVSNTQTVASANASTPTMASESSTTRTTDTPTETTTPAKPAETSAGSSSGTVWRSLITIEQLQQETKRIRNHLTQSLQSQGTYNGNYKELQVDGAVLAAIAAIVPEHEEGFSWKNHARYLREFGRQLNGSARALGKEAYTKSQAVGQNILAVLDGSVPADAGDPPATQPLAEAIDRIGLMYRIQKAKDWMKLEVNSESKFNSELDKIQLEASLVALFGSIVADKSYDYADEDDYKKFVRDLIDGGKEAAAAARDQSFPKFNDAIDKMQKACDQCHGIYGNG